MRIILCVRLIIIISCKIFVVFCATGPIITFAFSVANRILQEDSYKWQLPFGMTDVFDPHYSPNFEIALVFQVIGYYFCWLLYLATLLFLIAIFSYISAMFQCLSSDIISMQKFNPPMQMESVVRYHLRELRRSACNHQILLTLATNLEQLLSPVVFFYVFGFMMLLGCMLVQHPLTDPQIIKDSLLLVAGLLLLYMLSNAGNQVSLKSELVTEACYQIKLLQPESQFQKHLLIMMVRGSRPVKFTAYKFAHLGISTFVGMLKVAFSYFNVYRSVMKAHD